MLARSLTYARFIHWLGRFRLRATFDPDWHGAHWFNLSAPAIVIGTPWGSTFVRSWNVFNRRSTEGHYWGFGILQIEHRHLFAVMFSGVSILFVGKIP
jgi:hypothetical protein